MVLIFSTPYHLSLRNCLGYEDSRPCVPKNQCHYYDRKEMGLSYLNWAHRNVDSIDILISALCLSLGKVTGAHTHCSKGAQMKVILYNYWFHKTE